MRRAFFVFEIVSLLFAASCSDDPTGLDPDAGDTDTDSDADTDTDTDSDVDTDTDSDTDTDTENDGGVLDWIAISGGDYLMGCPDDECSTAEHPEHEVELTSFEMLRTEVTLAQYTTCVEMGACTEPMPDTYTPDDLAEWEPYITWGKEGQDDHPINAVNWYQAVDFCTWVGGRLPSEAEWEYAARSLGQDNTYPWGEEDPTCDYAIMWEDISQEYACDAGTTWPVCSKPAGNTAQGLCDMAGSVSEWIQDCYHDNYEEAPTDGGAWTDDCLSDVTSVVRGESFTTYQPVFLRTTARNYGANDSWGAVIGFRCAR
jgi:formylglycine-generating enzyme required for sulfatase activity